MDINTFHMAVRSLFVETYLDMAHEVQKKEGWDFVSNAIEEERFTLKSSGHTSRVVNHWAAKGLLGPQDAQNLNKWKKFTFIDLVWLSIVKELRLFGMELGKIQNTHASLYHAGLDQSHMFFKMFVALCLQSKSSHFYLLVFNDGNAHIVSDNGVELVETMTDGYHPYIKISLNRVCINMLKKENHIPLKPLRLRIDENDFSILESVLMDDYKELTAKRTKSGINITKVIPETPDSSPLNEAISDIDYGDILLKIERGKVVSRTKYLKEKTS